MPTLSRTLALLLLVAACNRGEGVPPDSAPDATTGGAASAAAVDPRVARADSARIMGSPDATVWVVDASDYQCPYCAQWHHGVFPALEREFISTGRVRFAYVNFPISSHAHSMLAAEAAMCAGAQGKFWEYHDGLFDTQQQWSPMADARPVFDSLATAVGLDLAAHRSCVDEHVMREMVRADAARMDQAGVNSTPTFFVGDQLLLGAQPIETFRAAISRALAATGADTAASR
ncbi:MAG TPA: thioredoxin domain-containing protein [Gemmatimonadales bacterium]